MAFERQEMTRRIMADPRARTLRVRDAEALRQNLSTLDAVSTAAVRIGLLLMPTRRHRREANPLQLVASIALVAIGLFLALIADTSGGMRIFGWVLVLVGILGLVIRSVLRRMSSPGPTD
jgi:hypothetical protein